MQGPKDDIHELQAEITQLKAKLEKAQNEIKRDNKHIRELFNSSNDLIQIFKPNGSFEFVNESWYKKLGYRYDEIGNLKFVDVIHPDHQRITLQTLVKLSAGNEIEKFETVLLTKYGKNIYVTGNLTCVFDGDEAVEFRCIFFDITERFRAERAQTLYYKIASITLRQLSLKDLYEKIHFELNDILKIRNFSVAFNDGEKYDYAFWINELEESGRETLTKDINELLSNYTFERGKPLIVYNDGIAKIARQKKVILQDEFPAIWLGVLIKLEGKPSGVMSVYSYADQGAYNHKDLELLDFVSGQISLAIEREKNEEKIQNQAARLSAIFESSTHQIWSLNNQFKFTSFNQNYSDAFETYYGYPPALGMPMEILPNKGLGKKSLEVWKNNYQSAFKGKTSNFQISQETLAGEKIWRDVFLNPIFMPDGSIDEISVIANDITEKKTSENIIKESEEKFRNIFESFQDVYFRCNIKGEVTMVSPSVVNMVGLNPEEIIGQKISNYFDSDISSRTLLKNLYLHQQIQNFEGTFNSKAGKIEFISNVRLIKRHKNHLEIEGVVRDITLLKETNRELRDAKNLAEKSLKIKERFLANMSHEIRTPMNGIIGMIDLIGSTNLDTEQYEYIKTIKKSSDTLLNIVNNILDLSKIEAGKMNLKNEAFSLVEAFEKVYELYSQQAHLSQNSLYYHLDDKTPTFIAGDETRLIQVLSNLTSNAIKFSPKKGTINIGLKLQRKEGKQCFFKVSIKDSGIGISKKDSEKLFKSFSQIDSSRSKNFSGTGLGLVISKELVKSMNGDIGVVSTPGLGSTFWFTFEALEVEKPISNNIAEPTLEREFEDISPRILIVDDNDVNRNVAKSILSKAGCQIMEASSGKEALKKITRHTYNLIFMDIQMPDMDGITASQEIRKILTVNSPPIIAMTAYSMEEDRARFLKEGMDDYISKPIKARILINQAKKWLNFEPIEVSADAFEDISEDLIINQNTLNQLFKYGGKELIDSVLKDFDDEATEQVRNVINHFRHKDFEQMRLELHTLKGNAGTFGVERISTVATRIELLLKENKFDDLEKLIEVLKGNLNEFKESYATFISS
ncbi:MAG: PAS domain S-box protein [Cyclobacteriaceae bacterium]